MKTSPTEPDFPPFEPTSGELIRHAAATHGDRDLVVLGDRRLSYRDAEARSAELARGLLASGVGKGTRVGLLAPNGPEWILGWLAATRIGAVVSLLNTYYKERELEWILRHSDTQVLITVAEHLGHDYLTRLENVAPGLGDAEHEQIMLASHPYLRSIWIWGEHDRRWAGRIDELAARGAPVDPEVLAAVEAEVTPADPMVVVYSSGSTSDPKGAVHTHGPTVRHAHNLWQFRDLRRGDVLYTPMPLFWVGGLSYTLIAAIHAGATLVFEDRFEPGATLDLLERERVTLVIGWPHMAKALTEHPSFAERDLSAIRGGSLPELTAPEHRLPEGAVRANSLGMTETIGPHTHDHFAKQLPESKIGSFGRSVPGVEHRIIDPLTGAELPPGELGEIWIRGYSLMSGLHKIERHDVFTPDGWYQSGDAGWFDDDGHLFYKGRMGDTIKSAGMNITPREVELVLESFDEVSLAFVTGVPGGDRGEDVVAAVVPVPGAEVTGDDLRTRVKDELASYKVPTRIEVFPSRDDLPWLDSGKIDLRGVKELLTSRLAD